MKLTQFIHSTGMGIIGCVLSLDVAAHALWLEKEAGAIRLYFGEYAENRREPSPGRLDSILMRALAVEPNDRYPSMSSFGQAIAEVGEPGFLERLLRR